MTVVTLIGPAPSAGAATAPPNDTWREATRLKPGTTVRLNTRGAGREPVDTRVNAACGAPYTKASVWYKYRPARTGTFKLDMTDSSYSGGFMVFRRRPTVSRMVTCGPGVVTFRGRADVRYFVMAFSDTRTNGGDLVLSFHRIRPPSLDLTLDPEASADKDGAITLTGDIRCSNALYSFVEGEVTQVVGRLKITGYGWVEDDPTCDGQWHDFAMRVTSEQGVYSGGKASVSLFGYACSDDRCAEKSLVDQEVAVRRAATG